MAEPKDYFINPCCFRDAVAKWLIAELRKQGVKTDQQPGQEDFGWYLNFEITGKGHTFVIGHRPAGESETGIWMGWLERNPGFIGSLLAGVNAEFNPLQSRQFTKSCRTLRWFEMCAGTSNAILTRRNTLSPESLRQNPKSPVKPNNDQEGSKHSMICHVPAGSHQRDRR